MWTLQVESSPHQTLGRLEGHAFSSSSSVLLCLGLWLQTSLSVKLQKPVKLQFSTVAPCKETPPVALNRPSVFCFVFFKALSLSLFHLLPEATKFPDTDLDLSDLIEGLFFYFPPSTSPSSLAATHPRHVSGDCECCARCHSPSSLPLSLSLPPSSSREKHLYSASSLMSAVQASTCFVRNELLLIKNQQK